MPTFDFRATTSLREAVNAWIADPVAAEAEYGHIEDWDTSDIDDMSGLFRGKGTFDDDISAWNTSKVTDMSDMFNGAEAFDQDISGWDTSKVTRMDYMFKEAILFAQDIREFDVSLVTKFTNMFAGATAFKTLYGIPDTPETEFFDLFDNSGLYAAIEEHFEDAAAAQAKYGKVEQYNTSAVTDMGGLFRGRDTFNLDISLWDTSNVEEFTDMFNGAEAFNQDISAWNTSKATRMQFMFKDAKAFDQNIGVKQIPIVPGTEDTVHKYVLLREDSGELTYKLTDTTDGTVQRFDKYVFDKDKPQSDDIVVKEGRKYAIEYAGDRLTHKIAFSLTDDKGTVLMSCVNAPEEHAEGTHVAGGLGGYLDEDETYTTTLDIAVETPTVPGFEVAQWDISNVTTINNMFDGAIVFDQPLGLWDVSSVKVMNNMFDGAIAFNQEIRSWTLNDDANVDSGCYTELFKGATAFHGHFGTSDTTGREFFIQTKAELRAAISEFHSVELVDTPPTPSSSSSSSTNYTIQMSDAYGDGWQGSHVMITDKGSGVELANLTLPNRYNAPDYDPKEGSYGERFFDISNTVNVINITTTRDDFPSENAWRIIETVSGKEIARMDYNALPPGGEYSQDVVLHAVADKEIVAEITSVEAGTGLDASLEADGSITISKHEDSDSEGCVIINHNGFLPIDPRDSNAISMDVVSAVAGTFRLGLYNDNVPKKDRIYATIESSHTGSGSENLTFDFSVATGYSDDHNSMRLCPHPDLLETGSSITVRHITRRTKFTTIEADAQDKYGSFSNLYVKGPDMSYLFKPETVGGVDASLDDEFYPIPGTKYAIKNCTPDVVNKDVLTPEYNEMINIAGYADLDADFDWKDDMTLEQRIYICDLVNSHLETNPLLSSIQLLTGKGDTEDSEILKTTLLTADQDFTDLTDTSLRQWADTAPESARVAQTYFIFEITPTTPEREPGFEDFNRPIDTWVNLQQVTNIEGMFENAAKYNQLFPAGMPLLTNMKKLFKGATSYNQPIDFNNYPLVTDLSSVLEGALNFDQTIDFTADITSLYRAFMGTRISGVTITSTNNALTNLESAFEGCSSLATFTLPAFTKLTTALKSFKGCSSLNQAIDFSSTELTTVESALEGCSLFNSPLIVTGDKITNASKLLKGCSIFNQALSLELPEVTTCQGVLDYCGAFNSDLTLTLPLIQSITNLFHSCKLIYNSQFTLDAATLPSIENLCYDLVALTTPPILTVPAATVAKNLFKGCISLNKDLSLNLPSVTNLQGAFEGCTAFNSDLTIVGDNVTNVSKLFKDCTSFNKSLTGIDTKKVTTMESMFQGCVLYNQYLADIDTSKVTTMESMFQGCVLYNQSFGSIDTSKVTTMKNMLKDCKVFNQNIESLEAGSVTDMEGMLHGCELYNQSFGSMDTSNVTNMSHLLKGCNKYNQSFGALKTQNVKNMESMLEGCSEFNQSLQSLDTGKVHSFKNFLKGCVEFNGRVGDLNVSNAHSVHGMFMGCAKFNQDVPAFTAGADAEVDIDITYVERTKAYGSTTNEKSALMYRWPQRPDRGTGAWFASPVLHSTILRSDHQSLSDDEFKQLGVDKISEIESAIPNSNIQAALYYKDSDASNLQARLNKVNQTNDLTSPISSDDKRKRKYKVDDETKRLHDIVLQSTESHIDDPINKIEFYRWSEGVTALPWLNQEVCPGFILTDQISDDDYDYFLSRNALIFGDAYLFKNRRAIDAMEEVGAIIHSVLNYPTAAPLNDQRIQENFTAFSKLDSLQNFLTGAAVFNKPLDGIDTSNVLNFNSMLSGANSFNGTVPKFDTVPTSEDIIVDLGNKGLKQFEMFEGVTQLSRAQLSNPTELIDELWSFTNYGTYSNGMADYEAAKATCLANPDSFMLFYYEGSSALAASNLQERVNSMMVESDGPINRNKSIPLKEEFEREEFDMLQNEIRELSAKAQNEDYSISNGIISKIVVLKITEMRLANASAGNIATVLTTQEQLLSDNGGTWPLDDGSWTFSPDLITFPNESVYTTLLANNVTVMNATTGRWGLCNWFYDTDINSYNYEAQIVNDIQYTHPTYQGLFKNAKSFNKPIGDFTKQFSGHSYNFESTFEGCNKLLHTNLPENLYELNVGSAKNMFKNMSLYDEEIRQLRVTPATDVTGVINGTAHKATIEALGIDLSSLYWTNENATLKSAMQLYNDEMGNTDTRTFESIYGAIENMYTTNMTDMKQIFYRLSQITDPDLSKWDVSNVTTMQRTFGYCYEFDSDLSKWDMSSVTNMDGMFYGCLKFNNGGSPDINNWDTSNVTQMSSVFSGNDFADGITSNYRADKLFNQPVGGWDTSKVTNMLFMFRDCPYFDQDLSNFDTSNVTLMYRMFGRSYSTIPHQFNNGGKPGINNWNTSKVTDMNTMFLGSKTFNQPLDKWDTSSVTNMSNMFEDATSFASGDEPRTPESWKQVGKTIDGEDLDFSTHTVSLSSDGSIVAIGENKNDGKAGHVRVYRNVDGLWEQVGENIDGEAAGDESGSSISLSSDGSVVAIGAPYNDGNAENAGQVRVYKNIDGAWTKVGQDIEGEAAEDTSGYVSLSGDGSIVAIGANLNDGNGTDSGHVRVYENVGGIWKKIGQDIDGEFSLDLSGTAVSLSSDGAVVAIGAISNYNNGNSAAGHARIYKNVDGVWTQVGQDIDGEAAGDNSGFSVSLSSDGSVVAIGAHPNDGNGPNSGHVRVYKNVDGLWKQVGEDIDGEGASDQSGVTLSLSSDGSVVAIGSIGTASPPVGKVRIYKNKDGTWTQVGEDIYGDSPLIFATLVSLSSDGSVVAIGTISIGYNSKGHVRVYKLDEAIEIEATELPWDTSSVTTMASMFRNATTFNNGISGFDTGKVENMERMFEGARIFNGDIGQWDVSAVTTMESMFKDTPVFNQHLAGFDTSNVLNFNGMFDGATHFNGTVPKFDTVPASEDIIVDLGKGLKQFEMFEGVTQLSRAKMFNLCQSTGSYIDSFNVLGTYTSISQYEDAKELCLANQDSVMLFYFENSLTPQITSLQTQIDSMIVRPEGMINLDDDVELKEGFEQEKFDMLQNKLQELSVKAQNESRDLSTTEAAVSLIRVVKLRVNELTYGGAYGQWCSVLVTNEQSSSTRVDDGDVCLSPDLITFPDESVYEKLKSNNVTAMTSTDPSGSMFNSDWYYDTDINSYTYEAQIVKEVQYTHPTYQGLFKNASSFNKQIGDFTKQVDPSHSYNFESTFEGCNKLLHPNLPENLYELNVENATNMFKNMSLYDEEIRQLRATPTTGVTGVIDGTVHKTKLGELGIDLSPLYWTNENATLKSAMQLYNNETGNTDTRTFESIYGAIENMYTTNVTDMNRLFDSLYQFNADLSKWDVSNVTTMEFMFNYAQSFNGSIANWDTSKVENMNYMFNGASAFNQNVNHLDKSSIKPGAYTNFMFQNARAFNNGDDAGESKKPLKFTNDNGYGNAWGMFRWCVSFNQDVNGLNASGLNDFDSMFLGATAFNQNVTPLFTQARPNAISQYFGGVFLGCTAFNNGGEPFVMNIKLIETENKYDGALFYMFSGATAFNQPVTINSNSMIDNRAEYMFQGATIFNKHLTMNMSGVGKISQTNGMFQGAIAFNQDLSDLDTSKVVNMADMFNGATAFNQNICNWDVSKVDNMAYMFKDASSFDGRYTPGNGESGRINTWNVRTTIIPHSPLDGSHPEPVPVNVTRMFEGSNIFASPFTSTYAGVYKTEWFEADGVTPIIALFFNSDIPCFDATTTILAKRTEKSEPSYIQVSKLMKGHLVQTHKNGFKSILHIGTTSVCLNMEGSELKDQMYRMKKTDNMTHDLLVTGRHSVLVDDWSSHYCKNRRTELSTATIEDKHILGAGYSTLFTQETKPTEYQIYHIALDGEENRYGLYANGGILCESLDKRSINQLSHEGPQLTKE